MARPKKSGPHRSKSGAARDKRKIASLYLRGFTQIEIAKYIKVNQSTVSRDIKKLIDEWRTERIYDINEAKARELAKIDELELVYWEAWRRSQEDAVTHTEGSTATGEIDTTQTKGQAGDPRFLDGVLKCIQKRCEILGVEAPTKLEHAGPGGGPIPIFDLDEWKRERERRLKSRSEEHTSG